MTALATFGPDGDDAAAFEIMFNPASLKVTVTNRLQDEQSGGNGTPTQNARASTTKLETEIVFDTTEDGSDVRDRSGQLKALALTAEGDPPRPPPTVVFRWGRFQFVGIIETFGETLDFWSSEGVPLRATVQLAMQGVRRDSVAPNAPPSAVLNTLPAGGTGATDAATRAGDPGAGRAIAAANGLESMRAAAGASVVVSGGVQLRAAASFSAGASAGASFGVGAGAAAGFGAGATAGFGAGASGGAGMGAGIGAGVSVGGGLSAGASFGASGSAGIGAAGGAFAGLGTSKGGSLSTTLDTTKLLPPAAPVVGSGARFDATGKLVAPGSSGLSAELSGQAGVRIV
jgi:hypothetical protein